MSNQNNHKGKPAEKDTIKTSTDNRNEYQEIHDTKVEEKSLSIERALIRLGYKEPKGLRYSRIESLIKKSDSVGILSLGDIYQVLSDEKSNTLVLEALIVLLKEHGFEVYESSPDLAFCIKYLNISNYFGYPLFNLEKNDEWIKKFYEKITKEIPIKGNLILFFVLFSKFSDGKRIIQKKDIIYQEEETKTNLLNRIKIAKYRLNYLYQKYNNDELRVLVSILPPWLWNKYLHQSNFFDKKTLEVLSSNRINLYSDFFLLLDSDLLKFNGIGNSTLEKLRLSIHREIKYVYFLLNFINDNVISIFKLKNFLEELSGSQDGHIFKQNKNLNFSVEDDNIISERTHETLLDELKHFVGNLRNDYRNVLRYRFGLLGNTPITFEEIGIKEKKTRERIRQIEVKSSKIINDRSNIVEKILRRIEKIRQGLLIPLTINQLSIYDPWFEGISKSPWVLTSIFNIYDVTSIRIHNFEGDQIIAPGEKDLINNLIQDSISYCQSNLGNDFYIKDLKEFIKNQISFTAPELIDLIFREVQKELVLESHPSQWDMQKDFNGLLNDDLDLKKILRLKKNNLQDSIEEILSKSRIPLNVVEIVEILRRDYSYAKAESSVANLCISQFFLYGRKTYGILRHLELSPSEINTINSLIYQEMNKAPNKQWHADQLLTSLANLEPSILSRLNKYKLCVCLKTSKNFIDLGRMVFCLNDSNIGVSKRIDFHESVEEILRASISPMHSDEIFEKIRKDRDLSNNAQILPLGKLVCTRPGFWGLIDKHLFLTIDQFQSIVDSIVNILRKNGVPMSGEDLIANLHFSDLKGFHDDPFLVISIGSKSKLCRKDKDLLYLREWGGDDKDVALRNLHDLITAYPSSGLSLLEIEGYVNKNVQSGYSADYLRTLVKKMGLIFDESMNKWKKFEE